jgi:hypothetical protein
MSAECPDDTKSLNLICGIFQSVLFFIGVPKEEYDNRLTRHFSLSHRKNCTDANGVRYLYLYQYRLCLEIYCNFKISILLRYFILSFESSASVDRYHKVSE